MRSDPAAARVSRATREGPPRVGLVLGGGGAVGAAYHAGVLAALHHDLAWDPRGADVIVGTSAGALVGALLRVGVPPSDLAAIAVGAQARSADATLVDQLASRPTFPPFTLRHIARVPRLANPRVLAGVATLYARRGFSSLASLALFLPEGDQQLQPHLTFLDDVLEVPWPEAPLLLCAVRRRDGRRTVFGPGGTDATLAAAIAASCAVPGYFAGVTIDDESYVDGGVISATNADVLRRHRLDLAVVVSPMTGRSGRTSLSNAIRRFCRAALDRELRALERAGIPSVVLEPGPDVLAHVTNDFMSETASADIARHAFLETGAQLVADSTFDLLRHSSRRPARARAS